MDRAGQVEAAFGEPDDPLSAEIYSALGLTSSTQVTEDNKFVLQMVQQPEGLRRALRCVCLGEIAEKFPSSDESVRPATALVAIVQKSVECSMEPVKMIVDAYGDIPLPKSSHKHFVEHLQVWKRLPQTNVAHVAASFETAFQQYLETVPASAKTSTKLLPTPLTSCFGMQGLVSGSVLMQ